MIMVYSILFRSCRACRWFLLLLPLGAVAETLPSFDLDYSSWHATDIVEVSEGPVIDGEVTITKVFKGPSTVDSVFTLDSLKQFKDKQRRSVGYSLFDEQAADDSHAVSYVNNQRMILFLKCPDERRHGLETAGPAALTSKNDLRLSMLWLEPPKVYCFIQ